MKIKKALIILIISALLNPLNFTSASELSPKADKTITISDACGFTGDTCQIDITASSIAMAGFQIAINYDPKVLYPLSLTNRINIGSLTHNLYIEPGKIQLMWYTIENTVLTDLISIEFEIISEPEESSRIYINHDDSFNKVSDENLNDIDVAYINGIFTSGYRMGDVGGTGSITVADAILILRHIVGLIALETDQIERGKVSGGAELSVDDAILILRYLVGLVEQLPVVFKNTSSLKMSE